MSRDLAADLIAFIDASPTPYHAVAEGVRRLEAAGFTALDEREPWSFAPGDRRYAIRSGSSLIAFIVGARSPAAAGVRMIGAHTDSPNLKLKPKAAFSAHGYRQIGVEIYGGVLLSTWLDRDLGVAGRLAVRTAEGVEGRRVDLRAPVLRIPNLAIHLNREVNNEGLKLNRQKEMAPVWGLEGTSEDALIARLAALAEVEVDEVLDHDLSLYDLQGGALGGLEQAFIHSARLDNLASCHAALTALSGARPADATRLVVLSDHEEVGSRSAQGADGPFLEAVLGRLIDGHPEGAAQAFPRTIARSFLVSADMAHAVHPNYADKHEPRHMPLLGQGPVIKTNANQSYATDGESAARFAACCREAGVSPQHFVTRTDLGCGSTIGPITAGRLGVRTVDVGNPMLSMHSCREMAAAADVDKMIRVLGVYLA